MGAGPVICKQSRRAGRPMTDRIALITGTTGQDGAYLAEFLLGKGYVVHGIKRRSSSFNTERVDHLYQDPHGSGVKFFLHYGDMTDSTNLIRIIQEVQPADKATFGSRSRRRNTPQMRMRLARCACSKQSGSFASRTKSDSIRPRPRSCSGWSKKCRRAKPRRFLPTLALRGGQALRLLDHDQLSPSLRDSRLQRHPVQS